MTAKRDTFRHAVHHVLQASPDGRLIFYTFEDYLVFFTVYCTLAERMGIRVLALCPMPEHVHQLVVAPDTIRLARFEQQYAHLFARLWNGSRQRKGRLFLHPYRSVAKQGPLPVRTALAYHYNHPVERHLAERAEEHRWNFLAYGLRRQPFSEPRPPSRSLQRALREIRGCREKGQYLNYRQLQRLTRPLEKAELQQFIDRAVELWNVVDYAAAGAYYGGIPPMLRAFHTDSGGEYELREPREPGSDAVYADCGRILLKERKIASLYEIPNLDGARKEELRRLLLLRTSAPDRQLRKFLHLPAQQHQRLGVSQTLSAVQRTSSD